MLPPYNLRDISHLTILLAHLHFSWGLWALTSLFLVLPSSASFLLSVFNPSQELPFSLSLHILFTVLWLWIEAEHWKEGKIKPYVVTLDLILLMKHPPSARQVSMLSFIHNHNPSIMIPIFQMKKLRSGGPGDEWTSQGHIASEQKSWDLNSRFESLGCFY